MRRILVGLAVGVSTAAAQTAPGPVFSLGQPPLWQPYAAALSVAPTTTPLAAGSLMLGAHHPVLSPVEGLLSISPELYGTFGHGYPDQDLSTIGARLLAGPPALAFSLGPDLSWRDGLGLLLSYQSAVRRGGLLGGGSMLRLDWHALGRGRHNLSIGITAPIGNRSSGRTRPRQTAAELPPPSRNDADRLGAALTASEDSTMKVVAGLANLIRAATAIAGPQDATFLASNIPAVGAAGEPHVLDYADALAHAFALASGDERLGQTIAARARDGLLTDVVIPYDSLFGEVRTGVEPLLANAHARFAEWLRDQSSLSPMARASALGVYERWLDIVRQVRDTAYGEWRDSRFVWLPFQLALTPDQYERQTQMDSLMARVVGLPFTDQNALAYLPSTQLPLEIARTIYAARDYHVLWVHDFPALDPHRNLDTIAYHMVADVYLPALTAAVKRYDSTAATGTPSFPTYMVVLDQYYYEPRNARLWMTILEDPMHARIRLPGSHADLEAHLRQRQQELSAAVAASRQLQFDAISRGGAAWIRRLVKVNVNITQPSDFSFRSVRTIPPLPFTPDNMARDHRKIAFYDLNEAHPYRGGMLIMGVGVGDEYASNSWEDRGYRLRGPVTLAARSALREVLMRNGFTASEIPEPLRSVKSAPSDTATERAADHGDYVGRALQVHNQPGFGQKSASVARALLYTLAPSGSVIVVPDGAWAGEEWAAMLAGAAARGSRVFIVTPSIANSPNPERPLVSVERDVMVRLLDQGATLSPLFRRTGGELRVGIFTAKAPADDPTGRAREVNAGLDRAPWLKQLFPFSTQALAVLDDATNPRPPSVSGGEVVSPDDSMANRPDLHQKTQLIARPGAIQALVNQPGWDQIIKRTMDVQSALSAKFAEQWSWTTPAVDTEAIRQNDALLRGYEQRLSEADRKRVSFYFSLGSENEDTRGMVLDGEANVIVSGFHAAAGLVDLYEIMARSTWVATPAQLDPFLPHDSSLMGRFAHFIRTAM